MLYYISLHQGLMRGVSIKNRALTRAERVLILLNEDIEGKQDIEGLYML